MKRFTQLTAVFLCGGSLSMMASTVKELATTVGNLATQLENIECDLYVKTRIEQVQNILMQDVVEENMLAYKVKRMEDLIGGASVSNSLTDLVTQKKWGYPGDSTGFVTVYGRLNALVDLVVQDTLLDKLGEYTDTPLRNGRTLWSQYKWALEALDLQSQVNLLKNLSKSVVLSRLGELSFQEGADTSGVEQLRKWASGETGAPDDGEISGTFATVEGIVADQDKLSEAWVFTKNAFTVYQNAENGTKVNEVDTALGQLSISEMTKAWTRIQNIRNKSASLESFRKELGSYDDFSSRSPFTVSSLFHKLQADLRGCESLLETESLGKLWSERENLATAIQSLQTSVENLVEGEEMSFSQTVLATLETIDNTLVELVKQLSLNPSIESINNHENVDAKFPVRVEGAFGKIEATDVSGAETDVPELETEMNKSKIEYLSTLKSLNSEVDLGSVVRILLHTWPSVAARIMGSNNPVEQAVYMGQYVQPGLTLVNCLEGVSRCVHLDPILSRLGKSLKTAHESTLLGKIRIKGLDVSPEALNTLLLIARLIENTPSVAFEKGDEDAFYQQLNKALGTRHDETTETLHGLVQQEPFNSSGFDTAVLNLKTQLNTAMKNLISAPTLTWPENKTLTWTDESWPNEFNSLKSWMNYPAIEASVQNDEKVDEDSLKKELYSQPFVYRLVGIPYVDDSLSWKALAMTNGGKSGDLWFWTGDQQTPVSVVNHVAYIAREGVDLLSRTENNLFSKLSEVLSNELPAKTESEMKNSVHFYNTLTTPFYNQIGKVDDFPAALQEEQLIGLKSRLNTCFAALKDCQTKAYPVNLAKIIRKLAAVKKGVPASLGADETDVADKTEGADGQETTVENPGEEVGQPAEKNEADETNGKETALSNLGEKADHPADTTLFGYLNGVLYECGAQLLINYIGSITDPGLDSCGTLYAQVRKAENAVRTKVNEENKEIVETNLQTLRTSLSRLKGTISYYYEKFLLSNGSALFDAVLGRLTDSLSPLLPEVLDLTTDYTTDTANSTNSPWNAIDALTEQITQTMQTPPQTENT